MALSETHAVALEAQTVVQSAAEVLNRLSMALGPSNQLMGAWVQERDVLYARQRQLEQQLEACQQDAINATREYQVTILNQQARIEQLESHVQELQATVEPLRTGTQAAQQELCIKRRQLDQLRLALEQQQRRLEFQEHQQLHQHHQQSQQQLQVQQRELFGHNLHKQPLCNNELASPRACARQREDLHRSSSACGPHQQLAQLRNAHQQYDQDQNQQQQHQEDHTPRRGELSSPRSDSDASLPPSLPRLRVDRVPETLFIAWHDDPFADADVSDAVAMTDGGGAAAAAMAVGNAGNGTAGAAVLEAHPWVADGFKPHAVSDPLPSNGALHAASKQPGGHAVAKAAAAEQQHSGAGAAEAGAQAAWAAREQQLTQDYAAQLQAVWAENSALQADLQAALAYRRTAQQLREGTQALEQQLQDVQQQLQEAREAAAAAAEGPLRAVSLATSPLHIGTLAMASPPANGGHAGPVAAATTAEAVEPLGGAATAAGALTAERERGAHLLAERYAYLGKYKEVKQACREARQLARHWQSAYWGLMATYEGAERVREAKARMRDAEQTLGTVAAAAAAATDAADAGVAGGGEGGSRRSSGAIACRPEDGPEGGLIRGEGAPGLTLARPKRKAEEGPGPGAGPGVVVKDEPGGPVGVAALGTALGPLAPRRAQAPGRDYAANALEGDTYAAAAKECNVGVRNHAVRSLPYPALPPPMPQSCSPRRAAATSAAAGISAWPENDGRAWDAAAGGDAGGAVERGSGAADDEEDLDLTQEPEEGDAAAAAAANGANRGGWRSAGGTVAGPMEAERHQQHPQGDVWRHGHPGGMQLQRPQQQEELQQEAPECAILEPAGMAAGYGGGGRPAGPTLRRLDSAPVSVFGRKPSPEPGVGLTPAADGVQGTCGIAADGAPEPTPAGAAADAGGDCGGGGGGWLNKRSRSWDGDASGGGGGLDGARGGRSGQGAALAAEKSQAGKRYVQQQLPFSRQRPLQQQVLEAQRRQRQQVRQQWHVSQEPPLVAATGSGAENGAAQPRNGRPGRSDSEDERAAGDAAAVAAPARRSNDGGGGAGVDRGSGAPPPLKRKALGTTGHAIGGMATGPLDARAGWTAGAAAAAPLPQQPPHGAVVGRPPKPVAMPTTITELPAPGGEAPQRGGGSRDAGGGAALSSRTGVPAAADRAGEADAAAAAGAGAAGGSRPGEPGYKYSAVVRGREREALQAIECAGCRAFYEAIATWGDAVAPTCNHVQQGAAAAGNAPANGRGAAAGGGRAAQQQPQPQQGGTSIASALRQAGGRHRFKYAPPATPEGFWDIGFGDTQDD